MYTAIYYLSGTGNSLYLARELQKRIPNADLRPIVGAINRQELTAAADNIGIVFPIHHCTVPKVILDFIKALDFAGVRYVFAIATRCGCPNRPVIGKLEKSLAGKGRKLDLFAMINMPSNDPKFSGWKPATDQEISKFHAEAQKEMELLQEKIITQTAFREEDKGILLPMPAILEYVGALADQLTAGNGDAFFMEEKCNGCGICEQVCLSGRIKLVENKPVWQKGKACYNCYACINFCPAVVIQIKASPVLKIDTSVNGRYHHPNVVIGDIAGQK